MNLPIPVVGVDPGPDWANNVNACLTDIDAHDHTPGFGVAITPQGLNINSDLTMNTNNLIDIRASRYTSQGTIPSDPSDLNEVYVLNGDLYFIDASGNNVRLTQGGSPAGGAGSITGLPSGTAGVNFAGSTYTFESATNTPATINVGSVGIAQTVLNGKRVTISANGAQAANYNLTLPAALPATASSVVVDPSGNLAFQTATANTYTPAFAAGTVTTSSNFFWYYLSSDIILIQGSVVLGAGSTGVNPFTITLPSPFVINPADYPQGQGTSFGTASINQGVNYYQGFVTYSGGAPFNELQLITSYNGVVSSGFTSLVLGEATLNAGNTVWISAIIKVS